MSGQHLRKKEMGELAPLCLPTYSSPHLPPMLGEEISPTPFMLLLSLSPHPTWVGAAGAVSNLGGGMRPGAASTGQHMAELQNSLAAEHALTACPSLFLFLLYIATLFWPFCFVHLSS